MTQVPGGNEASCSTQDAPTKGGARAWLEVEEWKERITGTAQIYLEVREGLVEVVLRNPADDRQSVRLHIRGGDSMWLRWIDQNADGVRWLDDEDDDE